MNTPEQNIAATLNGKKVLFIENDNSLNDGLDEFERILQRSSIDYKIIFDASNTPVDEIKSMIDDCDCVVFMTQWTYEISKILFNYIAKLKQKKIVVQVYINEPTWYYASQHGTHHDVYIYTCMMYFGEAEKETEHFYKLTEKAYWDYENEFDN